MALSFDFVVAAFPTAKCTREIVCITDNFKNLHGTKKFDGFTLAESLLSVGPLVDVLIPIGPLQL
jgi:hypothetical protein